MKLIHISLLVLVLGLTACVGLGKRPEPPLVSLDGIELTRLGWTEQAFTLTLNLKNPNNYRLPLRGLSYTLNLNGQPFAKGISTDAVTIAAGGTSQIRVKVVSNLLAAYGQAKTWLGGSGAPLKYSIKGSFGVLHKSIKLPFRRVGEISL